MVFDERFLEQGRTKLCNKRIMWFQFSNTTKALLFGAMEVAVKRASVSWLVQPEFWSKLSVCFEILSQLDQFV